jgi:DNA polymerase IV (DinB-like DNA polymerase)
VAKVIKEEVVRKESLTCSIGIGPNKLVAKIASDFQKPDGLTVVEERDVKGFLAPMPVDTLWGIGEKTKGRLNKRGVRTIGELASYDAAKLRDEFGVVGLEFHRMANGLDDSELVEERTPKSFSREHTFEEDTSDETLIHSTIDKLFEEIIKDVEENGFTFKTLTVKVRYEDFETHTHSQTLPFPLVHPDAVKEIAHKLLLPFLQSGKNIRLVGVRASNLLLRGQQKTLA